jgi:peptidyl-prolyl cis-trans isomerase SurA
VVPKAKAAPTVVDRIVARVNNGVVTLSELEAALNTVSPQQRQAVPKEELQGMILNSLIEKELISQVANSMGIMVGENEVDIAIEGIKRENNLNDSQFRASLAAQGMTIDFFRANLKFQILSDRLFREIVLNRIVVTENEVTDYLNGIGAFQGRNEGGAALNDKVVIFLLPTTPSTSGRLLKQAETLYNQVRTGTVTYAEAERQLTRDLGGDEGQVLSVGELQESLQNIAASLSPGLLSPPVDLGKSILVMYIQPRQANSNPTGTTKAASEFTDQQRQFARQQVEQIKRSDKVKAWMNDLKAKAIIQTSL